MSTPYIEPGTDIWEMTAPQLRHYRATLVSQYAEGFKLGRTGSVQASLNKELAQVRFELHTRATPRYVHCCHVGA